MENEMSDKSDDDSRKGAGEHAYKVFISHASADKDVAHALASRLRDRGLSIWLDDQNLKAGEEWNTKLREAIDQSRLCLVLLSADTSPSTPLLSKECHDPGLHMAPLGFVGMLKGPSNLAMKGTRGPAAPCFAAIVPACR